MYILLVEVLASTNLQDEICTWGRLTVQAVDRPFAALMSGTANASAVVAERASGGTLGDVSYVPSCSAGVSFGDYITGRAVAYDPSSWDYYKADHRNPSCQTASLCAIRASQARRGLRPQAIMT